ncbi:hypothetical protein ACLESD_34515 [Pyxidicoccus sp. 3LFB2]
MRAEILTRVLVVGLVVVGCDAAEEAPEPTAPEETRAAALQTNMTLWGLHSDSGAPQSWWDATPLTVSAGTRLKFTCNSGKILPWAGHTEGGFGCGGAPYTFWDQSLDPLCPFGSLVGKAGTSGATFCVCPDTPTTMRSAGTLYLGFNDGVSFADNSGSWSVTMTSETSQTLPAATPHVGMPFFGRFNMRCLSAPAAHHPYNAPATQWSTDLYALPGTPVRFYVPSGYKGYVVAKSSTCAVGNGGESVYIDIHDSADVKVGRALYSHLDSAVNVSFVTPILNGALLGHTSEFTQGSDCYSVDDPGDVHIHFELGTTGNNQPAANKACWYDFSGQDLSPGTPIGRFGNTGMSARGPCP